VLSICTGAFILGEAGLLDGRRCTTHWRNAEELARRYPAAKVDPDVLYVDDDPVITSAGTAAGIDACLYLVREGAGLADRQRNRPAHGGAAASRRRPGAVTSTSRSPLPVTGPCGSCSSGCARTLDQPLTVRQLAARANMSRADLRPPLRAGHGTTPQRWLIGQRILLAQQLLEESDETVDAIADRAGFGNCDALRHHFRSWRGTTPHATGASSGR